MNEKIKDIDTDKMFSAILTLKSIDECYDFFEDLCTFAEIREMSKRFRAALLLNDNVAYNDIVSTTGLSSATISRVNRSLKYGSDGYKRAISRMAEESAESASDNEDGKTKKQ